MVEANIVQDFRRGNTRIMIADNYCFDKTQEDIDAILARIAQNVQRHINAAATAGIYEQEKESERPTTKSMCCFDNHSCINSNGYAGT